MRRAPWLAAGCIALAAAALARAAEAKPPVAGRPVIPRRYVTWDMNVDGALGYAFENDAHVSGFGRLRGGLLFIDERDLSAPTYTSLGLVYELSDLSLATVGFQSEILSLSGGTWFQIGAMVNIEQVRPVFMAGMGVSLFGVEAQVRGDDDQGAYWALYGKVRIPISIIAIALSQ